MNDKDLMEEKIKEMLKQKFGEQVPSEQEKPTEPQKEDQDFSSDGDDYMNGGSF